MGLESYVLIAGFLFCVGLYGILTRRNAIGVLVSVELLVNAANINLAAFAHFGRGLDGQVFVLFTTALTVAEVVVGLALVILLFRRRKDILLDLANGLKG
ncbi:NADH-quinone oxidoreductase subunit NuoK [Myxococcota bacterium]|jgi:NADH-quinone oxidoreductase subunit K|nr:NADH-quinone oxidoreductase subunit NuoK [Myxococcota bacterium]